MAERDAGVRVPFVCSRMVRVEARRVRRGD